MEFDRWRCGTDVLFLRGEHGFRDRCYKGYGLGSWCLIWRLSRQSNKYSIEFQRGGSGNNNNRERSHHNTLNSECLRWGRSLSGYGSDVHSYYYLAMQPINTLASAAIFSIMLFTAAATTQVTILNTTTISPLQFDHLLIVAMENSPYGPVMGTGTGNATNAPFIQSLLAFSATAPHYNSFGYTTPISNCSTGCYAALTSGNDTSTMNVAVGSLQRSNIFDRLTGAGLTWKGFCEDSCPEGASHFPPFQYSDTYQSPNAIKTCPGCGYQHSWIANYTLLTRELNSTSPANLVWFTPTDCHNMHGGDNPNNECVNNSISCTSSGACIQAGDNYLKQLLVGTGTITNPAPGSALSTRFFKNPAFSPALLLWWDECAESSQGYHCNSGNDAPNLLYGTNVNTHVNHIVSTAVNYDEYSVLRTIETNWGLNCLLKDCNAPRMTDFFH